MLSSLALCFHVFSVLCSIVITSPGEERAGLSASLAFVCLICMHQFVLFLFLLTAACDCGTPWTFLLTFYAIMNFLKIVTITKHFQRKNKQTGAQSPHGPRIFGCVPFGRKRPNVCIGIMLNILWPLNEMISFYPWCSTHVWVCIRNLKEVFILFPSFTQYLCHSIWQNWHITLLSFCFGITWQGVGTKRINEPPRDNKMTLHPAKTQISLGIRGGCPGWSESSPSAWRKPGSLATHWAHSEDSDQTGWMPRLIWVFTRRTVILLGCHKAAQMSAFKSS